MGMLTTHILDVRNGKPAPGIHIALYRIEANMPILISRHISNQDGRTDGPILAGANFLIGEYQLEFKVGEYFKGQCGDGYPSFLSIIPIRFGVSNPDDHYHVPLVCSPWTYSTYRGS